MKKLPAYFAASCSALFLAIGAAPTPTPTPTLGPMVVFRIYNTLPVKVYAGFTEQPPRPHDSWTIRPNNLGEYHVYTPVTLFVREDGMFKTPCGTVTVKQPPAPDFYVRRVGDHGCKLTNS
jgi:hypothetical protein